MNVVNFVGQDMPSKVNRVFSTAEIAKDCIRAAQERHGERPPQWDRTGRIIGEEGPLWKSFRLLRPTHDLMNHTEFAYRAHCQELLDRVVAGEDTCPPTRTEMTLTLTKLSLEFPLHGSAFGLYLRLFNDTFPQHARKLFADLQKTLGYYERMYGQEMDEHERFLLREIQQEWRR